MQLTNKQKQEGWRIVKFGDVAQEVKASSKDPLSEGIERYIGLEHIDPESLRLTRWGSIEEDNPSFTKKFSAGDILFGRRRAYLKKAAVADFDGICSGDIIVIAPKDDILLPDLLPFIVQSDPFFDWAVKHSAGGLSPRTKFKALADFQFPLPPRERQEEMLEVFEKIEDNLLLNTKSLKSMNILIRSLTYSTVLGSDDKVKLSDVAEIIMGQSPKGKSVLKEQTAQALPLLNGPSEFTDEFPIPVQYTTDLTRISEKDDVLLCVRGSTTGRINVADQKYCIGRGLAAIRARKSNSDTRYIMHTLFGIQQSIYDRAKGAGSTFPNITRDELEKWPVSNVQLDMQMKISNSMDLMLEAKKVILGKIGKLNKLKRCYLIALIEKG